MLLLAGLLFDAFGLIRRDVRWNWAAVMLSGAGTVFLLLAFVCGIYAEIWAGRAGVPQDPIEWHEFLANVASWGFVVLMAWRVLIPLCDRRHACWRSTPSIGLFYYVLLGMTAYFGGQLVFSYGAAVIGGQANTVVSLHDLNTLATRQTDLNLNYSELMHHIFGWMTLALSGSLLAKRGVSNEVRKAAVGGADVAAASEACSCFSLPIWISIGSPICGSCAIGKFNCIRPSRSSCAWWG